MHQEASAEKKKVGSVIPLQMQGEQKWSWI